MSALVCVVSHLLFSGVVSIDVVVNRWRSVTVLWGLFRPRQVVASKFHPGVFK